MALCPPSPGGCRPHQRGRVASRLANAALPELTWRSLGTPDRALVLDTVPGEGIFAIGDCWPALTKRGCAVDVVTLSAGDVRAPQRHTARMRSVWQPRRLREHRSALDILLPASRLIYLKLPVEALAAAMRANRRPAHERDRSRPGATSSAPLSPRRRPLRIGRRRRPKSRLGSAPCTWRCPFSCGTPLGGEPALVRSLAAPAASPRRWPSRPAPWRASPRRSSRRRWLRAPVPASGEQALVFRRPVEVVVADRLRLHKITCWS